MLMVVMLMFSMSATVFAAEFKDTADSPYCEAIDTLAALDMVGGYGNGQFGPKDPLTRAQAATLTVRALGGSAHNHRVAIYTDVPTTHWAFNTITEAYYMGLMGGYGNNVFGPEDKLTYDQVSQVMLNILGYKTNGNWPSGVRQMAADAGLYDGIKIVDGSDACTREVFCQMMYNAFDCRMLNDKGLPTGETFLESLGYEIADSIYETYEKDDVTYYTGHKVVTYNTINNDKDENIVTHARTTYEKAGTFDNKELTVGKKTITITEYNFKVIVDGKEMVYGSDKTGTLTTCKDVTVIYENNDKGDAVIVAIVAEMPAEVTTYGVDHNFSKETVKKLGPDYIKGISVVTKIDDEYIVSNDTYIGYVVDSWSNSDYYFVEFSDETVMKFDVDKYSDSWYMSANSTVIIFHDYEGTPVDFAYASLV